MATLKEKNENLEKYIKNELSQEIQAIEDISEQLRQLVEDTAESQLEFAVINTDLKHFVNNLKELSVIIKGDANSTSLLTKIALLTKTVQDLEEWVKAEKEKQKNISVADKAGKWQLIAAIITGSLGLITSVINIIINLYKHG